MSAAAYRDIRECPSRERPMLVSELDHCREDIQHGSNQCTVVRLLGVWVVRVHWCNAFLIWALRNLSTGLSSAVFSRTICLSRSFVKFGSNIGAAPLRVLAPRDQFGCCGHLSISLRVCRGDNQRPWPAICPLVGGAAVQPTGADVHTSGEGANTVSRKPIRDRRCLPKTLAYPCACHS